MRRFLQQAATIIALLLACATGTAWAHPAPFSYIDARIGDRTIDVSLVAHVFDLAHELGLEPPDRLLDQTAVGQRAGALTDMLQPRFSLLVNDRPIVCTPGAGAEVMAERQSIRFVWQCPSVDAIASVAVRGLLFPYDPQHETFVNVYESEALTMQAILDERHPQVDYFAGTRQGVLAVIARFLPEGIHHILIGPDHLLFLVGLLLPGGTLRRLLLIVTAFTAAHSFTLSLAVLGWLTPPARLVEPAIALSIVYVAADNLFVRGQRDVRAWAAFGFGFIHGFGFASVLREIGLPARALGWSLASFNVGVELGQMVVVAVVAAACAWIRAQGEVAARRLAFIGSLVVMAAGAFWFVQRVFFPGGSS